VLLLDQAGWHLSGDVTVPASVTLLPLRHIMSIGLREWAHRF
jgi:hypothetical protein